MNSPFRMVPETVKSVAKQVSEFLFQRGVSHAVIGGMAVSAYSPARMTEDVDFIIPAADEGVLFDLGDRTTTFNGLAGDGITVFISSPDGSETPVDFLLMDLPDIAFENSKKIEGIPIVRPEVLIYMKIMSHRKKDEADIYAIVNSGQVDMNAVKKFFKKYFPDQLEDLESDIMLAELESKNNRTRQAAKVARDEKYAIIREKARKLGYQG